MVGRASTQRGAHASHGVCAGWPSGGTYSKEGPARACHDHHRHICEAKACIHGRMLGVAPAAKAWAAADTPFVGPFGDTYPVGEPQVGRQVQAERGREHGQESNHLAIPQSLQIPECSRACACRVRCKRMNERRRSTMMPHSMLLRDIARACRCGLRTVDRSSRQSCAAS